MRTKEGRQETISRDKPSQDQKVFGNVVRGFRLVHDPEGSRYENVEGGDYKKRVGHPNPLVNANKGKTTSEVSLLKLDSGIEEMNHGYRE